MLKRWQEGERNGLRLCEEIQAQGYKGSARTIYRFLAALKSRRLEPGDVPQWPLQDFTAHEAVWLFVRDPEGLDDTEREELATIRQASATAESTYQLVQDAHVHDSPPRGRARRLAGSNKSPMPPDP